MMEAAYMGQYQGNPRVQDAHTHGPFVYRKGALRGAEEKMLFSISSVGTAGRPHVHEARSRLQILHPHQF